MGSSGDAILIFWERLDDVFEPGIRRTNSLPVIIQPGPDNTLGCAPIAQIKYGVRRIQECLTIPSEKLESLRVGQEIGQWICTDRGSLQNSSENFSLIPRLGGQNNLQVKAFINERHQVVSALLHKINIMIPIWQALSRPNFMHDLVS
jgi:hypothetical protein